MRLARELPTKFMLIADESSDSEFLKVRRGTIRNISAGGALLEASDLNGEWAEDLKTGKIKLALEIEIPDIKDTVRNLARVAWFSEINKENETKK
ncbi:MAG: hypothetical protein ABIC18_01950, partial [Candidatus Omnitrophota bacterium]